MFTGSTSCYKEECVEQKKFLTLRKHDSSKAFISTFNVSKDTTPSPPFGCRENAANTINQTKSFLKKTESVHRTDTATATRNKNILKFSFLFRSYNFSQPNRSKNSRMSHEAMPRTVPPEGTNTELDNSELLRRVLNLEILNIKPIKLEGFSPRSAGDASHLEVNGHEIGVANMAPEVGEGGLEVGLGNVLESKGW